jgi:DNA-binding transcriptional LysR family regulator
MELRQLEYFVAVAEEENFTRAAKKVRVAQPGISAQIQQLEHELGQRLFDRSRRRVRLTDVGAAVLPYAQAALEAVQGARMVVSDLVGLVRGHVSVGMITSCSSVDLPEMLTGFCRDYPAIELTLSEAHSDVLVEELVAGRLDLALIGLAGAPPSGIELLVIADEALVAAVSRHDPLTEKTNITLQALKERPLISLPPGTGIRSALDQGCVKAGFRPRIRFEASSLTMLAQLARLGLGVAILPESVARNQGEELHALAISRPQLRSKLGLAWRTEGPIGLAARTLINHARREFSRKTVR